MTKIMNTNSNVYTICYASVMVIIVALLLAVVSAVLAPRQQANVELDTKKQILNSLNLRGLSNDEAEATYAAIISEQDYDGLTVYEARMDNGEIKFVLPVRGAGLWGPIWGYVSVDETRRYIHSVFFNHEGETPGLGGEIKNYTVFQQQFEGKPVFGANGLAMTIEKAGNGGDVDCISGATITSKGVETMLSTCMEAYRKAGFFNARGAAPAEVVAEAETVNVEPDNMEE